MLGSFLSRELLQEATAPPVDGVAASGAGEEDTQDVRIIAIFTILAAGLLGGLSPLYFKCFRNAAHPATLLLRALAGGVILALAVIHVIPDGSHDLEAVLEYPAGPCCVVFGVLAMVMLENMSRTFLSHQHAHGSSGDSKEETLRTHLSSNEHDHSNKPEKVVIQLTTCSEPHEHGPEAPEGSHTHSCLAVNNAANWASNPQHSTQDETISSQIMAYMFELACVIHSFLIGIALGVTVGNRGQAVSLLVALVFHQGLEGIGLGSVVIKANFSMLKSIIMILTYSLMTPLGVAIGMGVAGTYDPESMAALTVQGVLNSISGGLLLYISLVQLIAEDFTRTDLQRPGGFLFRLATYAALALGAACMAVIAIWN